MGIQVLVAQRARGRHLGTDEVLAFKEQQQIQQVDRCLWKTNIENLWGEVLENVRYSKTIPVQLFISLIGWEWGKEWIGANRILAVLQNVEFIVFTGIYQ